jgi:hypothetical protein
VKLPLVVEDVPWAGIDAPEEPHAASITAVKVAAAAPATRVMPIHDPACAG